MDILKHYTLYLLYLLHSMQQNMLVDGVIYSFAVSFKERYRSRRNTVLRQQIKSIITYINNLRHSQPSTQSITK